VSRAEVIRQAIASYIEKKKPATVEAFGLWKGRKVDGWRIKSRCAPNVSVLIDTIF